MTGGSDVLFWVQEGCHVGPYKKPVSFDLLATVLPKEALTRSYKEFLCRKLIKINSVHI